MDDAEFGQHREAHRRIAEGLTAMAAAFGPDAEPHPYIRRHLAQHASSGGVLDDLHLPPAFLPRETGGGLRGLLGLPVAGSPGTRALSAWASIEPFVGDAGYRSRASSLQLALASSQRGSGAQTQAMPGSLVRPLWSEWDVQANVLARAVSPVRSLTGVLLPGGRRLVAAGNAEGNLLLWDPETGCGVGQPIAAHQACIDTLTVLPLPDGIPRLVSAGRDRVVRMWNPVTGGRCGELPGHEAWITALVVLPGTGGSLLLASADAEGVLRVWDPATEPERALTWPAHPGYVSGLITFTTPEGHSRLVSAGRDRAVRVWDPSTGLPVGELTGSSSGTSALAALPQPSGRTLLAAGDTSGTIRVWDLASPSATPRELGGHDGQITAMSVLGAPDGGGSFLATGDATGDVRIWDLAAGTARHAPGGHQNRVTAMTVFTGSGNRPLLATAGDDRTLRLWDPSAFVGSPGPSGRNRGRTRSLSVVADGGRPMSVTAGADGCVTVRDLLTGVTANRWTDDGTQVTAAMVDARGPVPLLVTSSADRLLRFRQATSGRELLDSMALVAETGAVVTAAVPFAAADGGPRYALAVGDGVIHVCDPSARRIDKYPSGHRAAVTAMAVFPGLGRRPRLVTVGRDGLVLVRDALTGRDIGRTMTGHQGAVNAVAVLRGSGRRTLLATAGADRTVRLWDPSTGDEERVITGHEDEVHTVVPFATSRELPLIATAGDDCTLRVWAPEAGDCLLRVVCGAPVRHLAVLDVPRPVFLLGGAAGYLCFEADTDALGEAMS
ncbi:WD40 repeat domain-containing protein [Streptomyces sp. NPDC057623]|uniref:WD40 repeat domain-containing protein n=1 Tax=Streptomyces sp. NPDC057623 TaxID=3346187 RepID=UPI00368EE37D